MNNKTKSLKIFAGSYFLMDIVLKCMNIVVQE